MIPLLDLRAQYSGIKEEIEAAVLKVLASGQYVLGDEVAAFEEEFAKFCGAGYGVAVNTGTSALHLALLAAGVGPGDEVITVPFTFVASAAAIDMTGARPVFVDIGRASFTMDPVQLEKAITPRTRAIMPVHLYGQMADMDAIMAVATRHGIPVIEDACQAHGASYHGEMAGSMGLSGCFSFYPGKNLGACGEGGIVVTSDPRQARKMRMLRDWGQEQRYHHLVKGFNYRMDALQGAILRVKLRHLDEWTAARRKIAHRYSALLQGSPVAQPPAELAGRRHVYHIYAVRVRERDEIRRILDAQGIQTGLHYPIPVHLQPTYAELGYRRGDFPESEKAAHEVLSLPIHPDMTLRQAEEVIAAMEQEAYVH